MIFMLEVVKNHKINSADLANEVISQFFISKLKDYSASMKMKEQDDFYQCSWEIRNHFFAQIHHLYIEELKLEISNRFSYLLKKGEKISIKIYSNHEFFQDEIYLEKLFAKKIAEAEESLAL